MNGADVCPRDKLENPESLSEITKNVSGTILVYCFCRSVM